MTRRGAFQRKLNPLFREIFGHHEAIEPAIADAPGGVRVTEASWHAQVVLLIPRHAERAVAKLVARGMKW